MEINSENIKIFDDYYDTLFIKGSKLHARRAISFFEQIAELGYLPALVALGYCYNEGIVLKKNIKKAMQLYRKAAKLDSIDALYNLGILYNENKHLMNHGQAFKYFKQAAILGDVQSQANLGYMYYCGEGCRINYAESKKWSRRAAMKGDSVAQYNLGILYIEVENKIRLGKGWMQKAARAGHKKAIAYMRNI